MLGFTTWPWQMIGRGIYLSQKTGYPLEADNWLIQKQSSLLILWSQNLREKYVIYMKNAHLFFGEDKARPRTSVFMFLYPYLMINRSMISISTRVKIKIIKSMDSYVLNPQ